MNYDDLKRIIDGKIANMLIEKNKSTKKYTIYSKIIAETFIMERRKKCIPRWTGTQNILKNLRTIMNFLKKK